MRSDSPFKELEPTWWPPKVGDALRTHAQRVRLSDLVFMHAPVRVVAVFKHNNETLATVADYDRETRRWRYTTIHGWSAARSYWPEGTLPDEGNRMSHCRDCAGT